MVGWLARPGPLISSTGSGTWVEKLGLELTLPATAVAATVDYGLSAGHPGEMVDLWATQGTQLAFLPQGTSAWGSRGAMHWCSILISGHFFTIPRGNVLYGTAGASRGR